MPMASHQFGGWKASLFGDHHMYGPERKPQLIPVHVATLANHPLIASIKR
jgi:hypothetical protein